ncbi:hypothetical protein DAI22_05g108500 [Oryza sativa Japonica Group]|nr:hypothetical protein DAI22_05g108500 [Oryza sativa Japonica Group]
MYREREWKDIVLTQPNCPSRTHPSSEQIYGILIFTGEGSTIQCREFPLYTCVAEVLIDVIVGVLLWGNN